MRRIVYILAASHSGSTLLSLLLNAHRDVATVGELAPGHMEAIERYRCSCNAMISACPFWQTIEREALARGIPFRLDRFGTRFELPESRLATRLLRPLHRGVVLEAIRDVALQAIPPWRRRVVEIMRTNEVLVDCILAYYRAQVFVDKGNMALRLKYLLRIPSFDIKVIRLIRDGRAVASTYMDPAQLADATDPSLRGGGAGGDRAAERLAIAEAAHEWRRSNEEAEHALASVAPANWMEVRYEDLCRQPDTTLGNIFSFAGLDPTRMNMEFRHVEHHVVGNGMRLDSTEAIRLDERWRYVLTLDDLHTFERQAGALNRRYGYT